LDAAFITLSFVPRENDGIVVNEGVEIGFGLGNMKVKEVLKSIELDGWRLVAVKGSHRQYKHPSKPGRVTIAGKPSDDLPPGALNSIAKQAQIDFRRGTK
jgi:predicted RNA binding protein YcfA (HicA-like mRNA interferase family)